MKKQLFLLLKLFLFWISFFVLQRAIFIAFHFDSIREQGFYELLKTFRYGFNLDLSVSSYLMGFPLLLFFISCFSPIANTAFRKIVSIYHLILLVLISLLTIIDFNLYEEWGSKLNSRAIEFLILSPGEALASSASSPILLSMLIFGINLSLAYIVLIKWVQFDYTPFKFSVWNLFAVPAITFLAIIGLRGGVQLAPINQSAVYFSNKPILNHTALNTEWNLLHSFIENNFSSGNPYITLDQSEAEEIVKALYPASEDSTSILTVKHPNVVCIILESFTADVVEAFGGEADVSPFLSAIAREGLRFSNAYASGDRTDKGLIAILSGYPTQASRSIIQQPDKFEKLPSLVQAFNEHQYHSSFVYGGESEFANIKSYLRAAGIEKIIDKNDFPKEQMNSKWGAHDGYVFDKQLEILKNQAQPFFSVLLTLSSHEPFEVPIKSRFQGDDLPGKFRKAANYTDLSLGEYFAKAKQEEWYDNTLFIIVADHGHRLPKEYNDAYDPRKFHIPLIFYGEVLRPAYRGKQIDRIVSQTDIASTLLRQLYFDSEKFKWSKNMLDDSLPEFAFYSFDNGFGWISSKKSKFAFDNVSKEVIYKDISSGDSLNTYNLNNGKAYMQCVFESYLNY